MEPAELDIMLEELETRVERLRSLYEQYFLGIEKIPPHVAQKDVDRRLYMLRREQIRNTAKRFKLQTIVQRYNTFQQYWMRIMREIENGTYRRHVLRAERTVGITDVLTAGERKRLGLPERVSPSSSPARPSGIPQGDERAETAANAPAAVRANADRATSAFDSEAPKASPEGVREQMERELARMLDDSGGRDFGRLEELDDLDTKAMFDLGKELDDPLLSSMPPPARQRKPSAKPLPRRSMRPSAAPGARAKSPIPDARRAGAEGSDAHAAAANATANPTQRRSARPGRMTGAGNAEATATAALPGSRATVPASGGAAPVGLRLPASSAVAGRGLPPKPATPRGAPVKVPSRPIIAVEAAASPSTASSKTNDAAEPRPLEPRPIEPRQLAPRPLEPRPLAPRPLEPRPVLAPITKRPEPLAPTSLSGPAAPVPRRPAPSTPDDSTSARTQGEAPLRARATAPSVHLEPREVAQKPNSSAVVEKSADHAPAPPPRRERDSVPRGLPDPRDSVIPRASTPPGPKGVPASVRPGLARPVTAPDKPKNVASIEREPTRPVAGQTKSAADPLDRTRIEQIAEKLRDARKQTHEATAVSVDALAKKLEATADELRKKHAGKHVDFDVVIKDGKAILKPVVR